MDRARALLPALILVAGALAVPGAASAAEQSRYVVMLSESAGDPGAMAAAQAGSDGAESTQVWNAVEGYSAELTAEEAAAVAADPAVESVTKDRTLAQIDEQVTPVACQAVADPRAEQCLGENLARIDGDESSTHSGDGSGSVGTNIAVLDSGVDRSHPELNVAGGVDCGTGQPVDGPGAFVDDIGHGTFVSGVAAARDNGEGIVGVAPGAPVWSVKVTAADGSISDSAILCAIDWVMGTMSDDDPANDIAVANVSLGGVRATADDGECGLVSGDPLHLAICRSVDAGTLYSVAAGNAGQDFAQTVPATYDEVLTATAMTDFDGRPGALDAADCFGQDLGALGEQDDAAATYSNAAVSAEDRAHTIAGPATCVPSLLPVAAGSYGVASGTSFSAPIQAGTAALCIDSGRCPDDSPMVTRALLLTDAAEHSTEDPDYGYLGDPLRPAPDPRSQALAAADSWYGFLVWSGRY